MKLTNLWIVALLATLFVGCSKDEDTTSNLTAYFTTDKSTYYEGETVKFTDATTGGSAPYSYNWDFSNGETSTDAAPTTSYDAAGSYRVTLTVKDSNGKSAQTTRSVVVDVEPLPEVGNLTLKWVGSTPVGQIRSSSPAVANDGSVYMVSNDHYLRKYSATDGTEVWNYDLRNTTDGAAPEGNTNTTPSIDADGTIYIGTGDKSGSVARVYAINPDGTKKWIVAGDATTGFWNKGEASKPRINYLTCAITDTHVYMGNGGSTGSVLAVDKSTGHRSGYVANATNDGGPAGGVSAGMVVTSSGSVIWAGGKNGFFGASASALANANGGNTIWDWQVYSMDDDKPTSNANCSPAIGADGTIYVMATLQSNLVWVFALDGSGLEKWRTQIPSAGAQDQGGIIITEAGDLVVTNKRTAGEVNGGVTVLSSTGAVKWSYGVPEDVSGTAAVDQAGNIHFATQSGNYYIIDAEGELIVKKDLADMIMKSSVSYASSWSLVADDESGATVWSSPVIADDGVIYLGVTNNSDNTQSALVALSDPGVTGPADSAWPMKGQNRRHTSIQK